MTKQDWRDLAEARLIDAGILLQGQRWAAVYYLAGYAVECGLKACVVDFVEKNPGIIYEERGFSDACWTHSITDLVVVAGLAAACAADRVANPAFQQNWTVALNGMKRLAICSFPSHRLENSTTRSVIRKME